MKVPVPFVGWIEVEELDDMTEMLRQQIQIQQREILRLGMENQAAYQRGWSDAVKAATERVQKIFDASINDQS
jgi:FtsZ-binding cell division protein ZapB